MNFDSRSERKIKKKKKTNSDQSIGARREDESANDNAFASTFFGYTNIIHSNSEF